MTERPINFSAAMVRALLRDEKTRTMRTNQYWMKVKAGDRLWVKETYWVNPHEDEHPVAYRADGEMPDYMRANNKWSSPRFMPRTASRITLEAVADAFLQKTQDMTTEDAITEGITSPAPDVKYPCFSDGEGFHSSALAAFEALWNRINDKDGFRFADNPECVVISFRRLL